jgi:CHAD domain-containing protein/CYTH domain-containing protein
MATFEVGLLDESAARGARLVALALVADVGRERERLRVTDREPEALHDFRVALRRLRSWLRAQDAALAGSVPPSARRRLARIARESNAGRDAEVLIGWLDAAHEQLPPNDRSAVRWLRTRFDRQRTEAEAALAARLGRVFTTVHDRLQRRLETYQLTVSVSEGVREPSFAGSMAVLVREHGENLSRRLAAVRAADDAAEAHRARIAGKRLRYLLEPFAAHLPGGDAIVTRLRGLQDALGELHDAHIWLLILRDVVSELAMEEGRQLAQALTVASGSGVRRRRRRPAGPSRRGLMALAQLAQDGAAAAFTRFETDWRGRRRKRFFRDLEHLVERLEERALSGVEIERKYLLSALPTDMPAGTVVEIDQGYLPGSRLVERLRRVRSHGETTWVRTVKVGTGLVRAELEEATTRAVFDSMWPHTSGRRLTKRRHRIADGDLTWDVDEFTDRSLVLAELG